MKAQIAALEKNAATLGTDYEGEADRICGAPTCGGDSRKKGIFVSSVHFLPLWFTFGSVFEWQFSLAAILALSHDIISTIGLFALTSFEFNLATVAAILTIAGYSINDTVVVFDGVRENLRRYKSQDQREILNISLNETLCNTVMTSVTTALAPIAIIIFGGAVLRDFAVALLWGVTIGTYSSIFVAVGFISFFDLKAAAEEQEEHGLSNNE